MFINKLPIKNESIPSYVEIKAIQCLNPHFIEYIPEIFPHPLNYSLGLLVVIINSITSATFDNMTSKPLLTSLYTSWLLDHKSFQDPIAHLL